MSETAADRMMRALAARPRTAPSLWPRRMAAVLEPLFDDPYWRTCSAIKVTGSNGKGTVTRMIADLLGELGIRAGDFTSPHLIRFNERIRVGGADIADAALDAARVRAERWMAAYEDGRDDETDRFGSFELIYLTALAHFDTVRPDVLVLEAGLGGRFDPTRTAPGGIAVLTSVDLEHTRVLGDTRERIAYDKMELCPEGGYLIVGAADAALRRRIEAFARLRRLETRFVPDRLTVSRTRFDAAGMTGRMILDGIELGTVRCALPGAVNWINGAVAWQAVRTWCARSGRPVDPAARLADCFRRMMAGLLWPGRLETVAEDPTTVVDVGHTPAAVDLAMRTIESLFPNRDITLVVGISVDKPADEILVRLMRPVHRAIVTRAVHKGRPAVEVADRIRALRPGLPVETIGDVATATARARALASAAGGVVVAAGGLFLAMSVRAAARGHDPHALRFY